MHKLIFWLSFLLFNNSFAQNTYVILDSATNEAIPFASISCKETGFFTLSDEKGEWTMPDSITCKAFLISCSGYKPVELFFPVKTVKLSPLVIQLQDVEIGGERENVAVDNIQKLNCSYGFSPEKFSTTYGAYLGNPVKKRGWVRELSFHVSSIHKPDLDVPVRIRFFEWNEKTQMPGEEISTSNLILKPSKKGWNKINLEKAYQDFPENGIVVAFELLSAGPSHYHEYKYRDKNRNKHTGKYYGWYLTASCCSDCEVKGFHYGADKWYLWNKIGGNSFWAPAVKLKMSYSK